MKQSRNNKLFLFIGILLIIICIYYYFNNNEHYEPSSDIILNIPEPIKINQIMNKYTLKRTLNDNRPTDAPMISVIRAIQNDTDKTILWDIQKDRNMFEIYINNQLIQNINSTGTDSIIIGYQKSTDNNKTFNLYYSINGYEQIKTSKTDTDSKLNLDKDHTIEFFAPKCENLTGKWKPMGGKEGKRGPEFIIIRPNPNTNPNTDNCIYDMSIIFEQDDLPVPFFKFTINKNILIVTELLMSHRGDKQLTKEDKDTEIEDMNNVKLELRDGTEIWETEEPGNPSFIPKLFMKKIPYGTACSDSLITDYVYSAFKSTFPEKIHPVPESCKQCVSGKGKFERVYTAEELETHRRDDTYKLPWQYVCDN